MRARSLSLTLSLRAKCKTEVQAGPQEQGRGSLVLSCLFFSFLFFLGLFLKAKLQSPGPRRGESKRVGGEAERTSSPSYSSKMKKDFKASDPARRV